MRTMTCTLVSTSPYSQSRPFQSKKAKGEGDEVFEDRAWPERMHVDKDGMVYIPPMSVKNAIVEAAQYRGEKIAGRGMKTYGPLFRAGVMIVDPLAIGIKAKDVKCERLYMNADGKKGSGTRVWRKFPVIDAWKATLTIHVLDPTLESRPEIVKEHLETAGLFVGIGRWRPAVGGLYGRFTVEGWKA